MSDSMRSDSTPAPAARRRLHPVDGLVLLLAVALAVVAYAYLFRSSPAPQPGTKFLGVTVSVEFRADQPWKLTFPSEPSPVLLEDLLTAHVLSGPTPVGGAADRVRLELRIADRDDQQPDAILGLRHGLRRGSTIRVSQGTDEVTAEIVAVDRP